jgi:hypothetical protein
VSPSLCNRWRNGTSFFKVMKQAPHVVLSASPLMYPAPLYASGSSVPAALPRNGASRVSDCIAIGGLAGWTYCRSVSVTARLCDEP